MARAVRLHGHEGVAPAGVVLLHVAVALGIGQPLEVGLHHGAGCGPGHVDDAVAVVLDAVGRVYLIDTLCLVHQFQEVLMLADAVLGAVAHTVDIPGSHAHAAFHHLVVELRLRQLVHPFVSLHRVF